MKATSVLRLISALSAMNFGVCCLVGSALAQSPAPIWTGLYAGTSLGYQTGEAGNSFGSEDFNGISGGGYVGYAFKAGGFILGIEGSFNANDVGLSDVVDDGITTDTVKISFNNTIMLRARAGMPVGQALVYATAGVTWVEAENSLKIVDNSGAGTEFLSAQDWTVGYVVGGGIEIPISSAFKLRGEALYQSYEVDFDKDFTNPFDYDTTLIQAGISYYFN